MRLPTDTSFLQAYTAAVKSRIVYPFTVLFAATALALGSSTVADTVLGIWEGESKCTVPDSPCRDEHVIYTVMPAPSGGGFTMQADKVVDGERQSMGTLPCRYDAAVKRLTCVTEAAKTADWVFTVSGDTMTGTLTLRNEHQLYRRIQVKRQTATKNPKVPSEIQTLALNIRPLYGKLI